MPSHYVKKRRCPPGGHRSFLHPKKWNRTTLLRIKSIMLAWAASAGAVLYGCAVGPDYQEPGAPNVQSYTATPIPAETSSAPVRGGESQRLILGQDIPERWWSLFRCEALDDMIRVALKESPTIASAEASLREAEESLRAQYGAGRFPTADVNLSAEREKFTGAVFGQSGFGGTTFSLYNASVKVSYLLDFFGVVTRELEALKSQVDYQRYQLEGAYLALSSNVVTAAVQEASLRARLQATREILSEQEEQYALVQSQFHLGSVSRSDVLAQYTQLSQTRSTLPPLEKELSQTRHLLAVLLGRFPNDDGNLSHFDLESMELPRELPVSLPSSLTRQRPDVRAAEALLHIASAQVGVATANLYPKITLTGSYGSESVTLTDLFKADWVVWNLGLGLMQPLFHGGELTAKRRAALAAYDRALAQYRETVLQAFQNVADALRALEADARALKAEAEAAEAARKSLELTKEQFKLGAVNYLNLLNAQRQYQQTRISVVQAQAARFADTAALFLALGGGWWRPVPETETQVSTAAGKE
jgi:NodT family efflux transporter outer membrane factor (OMF) lipoprotein